MLSGRRLDLLDPSPLDVEIEDIAHGLARVARWNGQTWSSVGGSFGSGVNIVSLATHDLGSGPVLLAGGFFSIALLMAFFNVMERRYGSGTPSPGGGGGHHG